MASDYLSELDTMHFYYIRIFANLIPLYIETTATSSPILIKNKSSLNDRSKPVDHLQKCFYTFDYYIFVCKFDLFPIMLLLN